MGVDLVEAQRRNGGRAAVAARAPVARPAARGSGAGAIPAGASFGIAVDLTAFDLTIDQMAEACEQSARPAAQAGAQVLYEEVQRNVARLKKKTGNLARSIYQAYSKSSSTNQHAVYHVSWNYRTAPHGHLVEFGHLQRYEITFDPATRRFITHRDRPLAQPKQVAARPFVRPAVSRFPEAEAAMRFKWIDQLMEAGVIK